MLNLRVMAVDLLVLLSVCCVCVEGAEGEVATEMYSIGTSDMLHLTGATFHAYENAWSVDMERQEADGNVVLVFALCEQPCARDGETDRWQADRYYIVDCPALLPAVNAPPWHNAYVAAQAAAAAGAAAGPAFCDGIRSAPVAVQANASSILSDAAGGALVRLRSPLSMVLFNEPEFMQQWTVPAAANSSDVLSLSFRVTQVAAVGDKFAVRHAVHTVLLRTPPQRVLTLALRNGCTAIGLSAPAFGSVRSAVVGGRARCVWECRDDMLREPYNSQPPTLAQLDPADPEYAKLGTKYACVPLPQAWVATVFGFVVETQLSPTDVGYAQALFDAVDRLAAAVRQDLAAAGELGVIVFSIRDSVYHSSFNDRLQELQSASCVAAGASPAACAEASSTVQNPNYAYQRRRLLSAQLSPAQVEGLLVSAQTPASQEPTQLAQKVTALRSVLRSAVVKHTPLLADADGTPLVRNIEDVDFAEIVTFVVPPPSAPGTTPVEGGTSPTPAAAGSSGIRAVNTALVTLGGILCGVVALALCIAWKCGIETK